MLRKLFEWIWGIPPWKQPLIVPCPHETHIEAGAKGRMIVYVDVSGMQPSHIEPYLRKVKQSLEDPSDQVIPDKKGIKANNQETA